MFNLKFEKKIFLAVVTVILLTGVSSFGLAYAPSADVFAGLVGCPAENKSVFATQNLVYIFGICHEPTNDRSGEAFFSSVRDGINSSYLA